MLMGLFEMIVGLVTALLGIAFVVCGVIGVIAIFYILLKAIFRYEEF